MVDCCFCFFTQNGIAKQNWRKFNDALLESCSRIDAFECRIPKIFLNYMSDVGRYARGHFPQGKTEIFTIHDQCWLFT